LSNIIRVDFGPKAVYSADVYSSDMKKLQFEVFARSADEAHYKIFRKAMIDGVAAIYCVALYSGYACNRTAAQTPDRVWRSGDVLNEYSADCQ
jgi:hypothetical protein